jgi:hypothetical protein
MAALFRGSAGTALGTPVNAHRVLWGMTDGTTKRALGAMAENNQLTSNQDCRTRISNTHVIDAPLGASGAVNGLAEFTSFITGGATISWTDLLNAASIFAPVNFYDLSNVTVVEFTHTGAQNATQSVPDLGYVPDFAIFYSHWSAYAADSDTADGRTGYGWAIRRLDGSIQQWCWNDQNQDRAALDFAGASSLRDDTCVWQVDETTDGSALELTTWSTTPTFTKRNAAANVSTAILFGRFKERRQLFAGILPTTDPGGGAPWLDTSTTGQKLITCGVSPAAYFIVGTTLGTKNSTNRSNSIRSQFSEGVWTGSEETCIGAQAGDTNGGIPANSATRSQTSAKIVHVLKSVNGAGGGAAVSDWEASHVAAEATGPRVNIDVNSAAGRLSAIVVIGGVLTPAPRARQAPVRLPARARPARIVHPVHRRVTAKHELAAHGPAQPAPSRVQLPHVKVGHRRHAQAPAPSPAQASSRAPSPTHAHPSKLGRTARHAAPRPAMRAPAIPRPPSLGSPPVRVGPRSPRQAATRFMLLMLWDRQQRERRESWRRQLLEMAEQTAFERVKTDFRGSNAMAGSEIGDSAMAGSDRGSNPTH